MRSYYVCQYCGEINYNTHIEPCSATEPFYYSECKKCGKSTPWASRNEGIELTEEEIVNSIEYVEKKIAKIKSKAACRADLSTKKQCDLTTLGVIEALLYNALNGQFRIDCAK